MTRKTFILTGLFLIALVPLYMGLRCFLFLSQIIQMDSIANTHLPLFLIAAVPLGFGVLLWLRLRYIGKTRTFTGLCIFGFFVTLLLSYKLNLSGDLIPFFDIKNPNERILAEITAWQNAGSEGELSISLRPRIEMAMLSGGNYLLLNWFLFVVLYFGALGPRPPRDRKRLGGLLKRFIIWRDEESDVRLKTAA